ncbi:MAG TPA: CopD family protein [Anaerolineales bacterium]|nr:CopD family protein [Anaerolineales bacterium]
MPPIPVWVLSLFYWLHMLATVTWVGSLVAIAVLVLPVAQKTLPSVEQLAFIKGIQQRLEPVAWFSIGILVVTGLFQMSSNPHYNGFLATSNQWSLAILTKHVLVILMIVVSAIYTWDVLPTIRRELLRPEKIDSARLAKLQKQETFLLRANIVLAVLILAATAVARAS